ncbi:ester cyclase [Flavihumibacter sp. R14]|nr:ester cyclase [Flavihumibacter soli]
MSAEENKKLVERLFSEVISGKSPDALDQLISPKFAHHGVPGEKPGVAGFKETIKAFQTAFPDLEVHAQQIVAEGNEVATRGYLTGTSKGSFMGMPATGKQVRIDYIDWWRFEDGKAIENWVQMDTPGMMAQLGGTQAG